MRPYTYDYIRYLFTEFDELHGDRLFADDRALIGGLARLEGRPVMVIGHQKGRGTKEKVQHNFGMPPAGRLPQGPAAGAAGRALSAAGAQLH